MAETCRGCRGFSLFYDQANLKRCSGCHNAYYCSTECQQRHWFYHKFECNPRRPINTADHLALAVYEDVFPKDHQTCKDYGFYRAVTCEEHSKLLSLYIGLIKLLGVSPLTVHKWRTRGVLVAKIKETYCQLPEDNRGVYFPWFLKNEHVIAEAEECRAADLMRNAWLFIGGDRSTTFPELLQRMTDKPVAQRESFGLYAAVLSGEPPWPGFDFWTDFGFASCTSREEEIRLTAQYRQLIERCTFTEFSNAYRDHCLLNLFRSNGVQVDDHRGYLGDVLGTNWKKSVWYLKQIVLREDFAEFLSGMTPPVMVDYGFFNCRNDPEKLKLKVAYKAFFDSPLADPFALHDAAINGNIHSYVSSVVPGVESAEYQMLMKNPYPLAEECDDDDDDDEEEEEEDDLEVLVESLEASLWSSYDTDTDTFTAPFGGVRW